MTSVKKEKQPTRETKQHTLDEALLLLGDVLAMCQKRPELRIIARNFETERGEGVTLTLYGANYFDGFLVPIHWHEAPKQDVTPDCDTQKPVTPTSDTQKAPVTPKSDTRNKPGVTGSCGINVG